MDTHYCAHNKIDEIIQVTKNTTYKKQAENENKFNTAQKIRTKHKLWLLPL